MMNAFLDWLNRNRKPVGYTIGTLNLLAAINYAFNGQYALMVVWLVIGGMLILDTKEFK